MIVEAAIIVPLLLLLTFGTIEYGIAFRESAAVRHSTRAGSRIASAMPRNDGYADAAREAVSAALQGLGGATPLEVWIYKVDPASPGGDGPYGAFGGCTDCVGYAWDAGAGTFSAAALPGSDFWSGAEQHACEADADLVGVYVRARHEFVTSLFGTTRTLEGRTVMRLEPYVGEESEACR